MSIKIALAGNPNSGKTTMFNALTGSTQRVGNWPGVTVEKKEGKLKGRKDVIIQDLPGIYSLSPYTLEEVVARNYLVNERPDVIINIVDASNIERNLYLTTQLVELKIPVVVALNMIDIVQKRGDKINLEKLSRALGCQIVETSALKGIGAKEVAQRAISVAGTQRAASAALELGDIVEEAVSQIEAIIKDKTGDFSRWHAIKLFERDEKIIGQLGLSASELEQIENITAKCEDELDDDSESIITSLRYEHIANIMNNAVNIKSKGRLTVSDKIDRIVTNRFLALPIFALVMFLVYYISISTVGTMATDWVNDTLFGEIVPDTLGGLLESINTAPWLMGLIMDGIVGGVGAVLGFVPQMVVLFLLLALLEDCGYMARIAFIMDRIFRKFGLSGKSFIPMLISTGCAVPGIMASRTIENESDRRMTVITTSFMPCSAKLPIIALIAGALFNESALVATSAYFIGIAAILASGIILKKTKALQGEASPFIMELPAYHAPSPRNVLRHVVSRAWSFIRRAGSVILISTIVIWFASSFGWSFTMVEPDESILASIGNVIAPTFSPLGWGEWKSTVATITGLIAKEGVVSTLGVLHGIEVASETGVELWSAIAASFTALSAFSFLLFNLLCAPCFAAIGAIKREMQSAKWTWIAILYQTGLAYFVALVVYQIGLFISQGVFGVGTIVAILLLIGFIYLLVRPNPHKNNKINLKVAQNKSAV